MVKSNQKEEQIRVINEPNSSSSSSSCKYKGVRKRKWGKYVSEIRLPNSRERIWLGSYDTAQKAARAFDAAQFCLRGKNAKFNFPDNPPDILNGGSMTRGEIQIAAAQFARSGPGPGPSESGRVEALDQSNCSDSFSSGGEVVLSQCVESPSCASVSNLVEGEVTEMPLEDSFYDQFLGLGTEGNSVNDFGVFSGFDEFGGDYYVPPLASVDYWPDNSEELYSQSASLWNF